MGLSSAIPLVNKNKNGGRLKMPKGMSAQDFSYPLHLVSFAYQIAGAKTWRADEPTDPIIRNCRHVKAILIESS